MCVSINLETRDFSHERFIRLILNGKEGFSDKILANPEEAIHTFIEAFKEVGVKIFVSG